MRKYFDNNYLGTVHKLRNILGGYPPYRNGYGKIGKYPPRNDYGKNFWSCFIQCCFGRRSLWTIPKTTNSFFPENNKLMKEKKTVIVPVILGYGLWKNSSICFSKITQKVKNMIFLPI